MSSSFKAFRSVTPSGAGNLDASLAVLVFSFESCSWLSKGHKNMCAMGAFLRTVRHIDLFSWCHKCPVSNDNFLNLPNILMDYMTLRLLCLVCALGSRIESAK
ncbi:hypothetical protein Pyn_12129 [Prunus yedoensis var. nudiflora]|uniref:Uncharacterized protein n=1 Tax=Prunus yedoensis var. nudiflora TaxID=2094558 RepID=A0A314Y8Q0_PRUYE|nr:hypothetical protein Pyn_12129 [Prunus yedoensis var. nudiflora]